MGFCKKSLLTKCEFKGCARALGISKCLPQNPKYFKEFIINETICIPMNKPDMEDLLSIALDVEVASTNIIETPLALSNEGQRLSGCKLEIELRLKEKFRYVACDVEQSVHAFHCDDIMKVIFVILPCEINGEDVRDVYRRGRVSITPYVEEICAKMVDERTVDKNIMMLVDVVVRQDEC